MSARAGALALLVAVLERRTPLEEALDPVLDPLRLAPRDRGFARAIVATTLRRLGQIDAAIDALLDRPLPAKALVARQILRLGAAQLLFMGVPAHAAVGETVALAAGPAAPYRGLVNAVLRRLTREGAALIAAQDAPALNTPPWLWRAWAGAYGGEPARTIAEAHLLEAPLDLTGAVDGALGERLPTGTVRLPAGTEVAELPGYAEGRWWVQDAAAALPARLVPPAAGDVIDLCAAPGGKAAQLAAAGLRVTAVDRSAGRLERLRENFGRLRLPVETITADAAEWRPPAPAGAVLLDAPCSATGTARRHPDVLRLKTAADVAQLAALQRRLLTAAAAMLRPGGTLVYATCSLQPEEGEAQAAWAAAHLPLLPAPIAADELGVPPAWVQGHALRTLPAYWPDRGGLDGFFVACFRRA